MTSRGQTLDRIFVILNRLNEGSIGNIFPEYEVLAYKIVDGRLLKHTHTHTHTHTLVYAAKKVRTPPNYLTSGIIYFLPLSDHTVLHMISV